MFRSGAAPQAGWQARNIARAMALAAISPIFSICPVEGPLYILRICSAYVFVLSAVACGFKMANRNGSESTITSGVNEVRLLLVQIFSDGLEKRRFDARLARKTGERQDVAFIMILVMSYGAIPSVAGRGKPGMRVMGLRWPVTSR
jgi:hypothetical protein